MISSLARLLIAAAELLEAEGNALRRGVFATIVAALLAVLAVVVLLLAIVMLSLGVFLQLQSMLGTPGAAAISGGAALVLGLGILALATRITRPRFRTSLDPAAKRREESET